MNNEQRTEARHERRSEIAGEALARARGQSSTANYAAILQVFMAMGIAPEDIRPRENVCTYHAWRALGRQVRKGVHGVRCHTFVERERTERDTLSGQIIQRSYRVPRPVTVFHISQTDPIA